MEPWGPLHIDGWSWSSKFSDDENLLNLAYAASLNTYFFQRGMDGGLFGAALCRPAREAEEGRARREIEILGLGVHYPPRFADESSGAAESLGAEGQPQKAPTSRQLTGAKATTLHAEIMVVARCAREGLATEGSSIYCMQPPSWESCKALLMAGVARIVFQKPHAPGACLRQRDVVAATGAQWLCVPISEERRQFLQALRQTWHRQHVSGPKTAQAA